MTITKAEKAQRKAESIETLNKHWKTVILEPSSLLNVSIEYGKGDTDYVKAELYYVDKDGKGALYDLSWHIANSCGYSFRRGGYSRQLALGGGGYSKTYDVALALFHIIGIDHREIEVNFRYR